MISYIDRIKEFRELHKYCKLIKTQGNKQDEYNFYCPDMGGNIRVVMPFGCRYPSLDCAISGYCKRDIACNH